MRDRNILFSNKSLADQLRGRQATIASAIDGIDKDQFLISSDDELTDYFVARLRIEPLSLDEANSSMSQRESQIDVSGDPNRIFSPDRSGPFYVPATSVDIDIPFTGEAWLFQYRTNPHSLIFPRAVVQSDTLRISISLPHDADREQFKPKYEEEIRLVRSFVEHSCAQVEGFNRSLPDLIRRAINHRRARLNNHENISSILDIPLATKPGAPTIKPVKLEVQTPPALPKIPKDGVNPEPGLTDSSFELVLQFIRHQCRTFERTPKTFSVHDEEDLRNIILAQLNGHFRGAASGETFRRKGKTDILIEQDSRAAFVGECKIWSGPSDFNSAVDQLLGYLTWRDSKAALIVFNTKNKSFSKILESIPAALQSHHLFLRTLKCEEEGEWRVQMRSQEDEGRRVTLQVMSFDLFQS